MVPVGNRLIDLRFDHSIAIYSTAGFGNHISLFTILWAVSMLIYTYYNSKHMDMSANPAMKYMQYFMPIMFLGFFNSYASALTAYLLASNILNIVQTIVTKNYIIDQDKIQRELEAYNKSRRKSQDSESAWQLLWKSSKNNRLKKEKNKK